jgi:5-methylcytosine-specific restriction enzyme subunit McrC
MEAWLEERLYERLYQLEQRLSPEHGDIFKWHRHHAQPTQWVGVIQLPGLQLEIVPKVDTGGLEEAEEARHNLLYMLSVAGYVPIRFRETASLVTRKAPLGETLAAIFAQRLVAELLRGPERSYRRQEENLRLFKGKLKIAPHLSQNAAHRARFFCEYDDFTVDTELNRVFKAACRLLTASMRMPKTLEQLGHALLLLEDVQDVAVSAPLLDRVVIDRRNAHFDELFVFCRMLLQGHAPGAASGGTKTYSLLFDMNAVFEKFVAAFLRKRVLTLLPGHRLVEQGKRQGKFLVRQGGRGVLHLKPDLTVIAPDGSTLVIDTKWKRLQSEREDGRFRIGNADLYQLYAYADRFSAKRSLLLYPKLPQSRDQDFELMDPQENRTGRQLGVRFVDLHRDLGMSVQRQSLAAELKTMIESGLASGAANLSS